MKNGKVPIDLYCCTKISNIVEDDNRIVYKLGKIVHSRFSLIYFTNMAQAKYQQP